MPVSFSCSNRLDDLLRGVAVESAGRLVGEDDVWVVDESPGDRHALLLTAGELRGLVRLAMRKADLGEALFGFLARVWDAAGGNRGEGSATLSSAVVRASRLKVWKTKPILALR